MFIGIDVAKAQLEFACRPTGETGTVVNAEDGIRELVTRSQVLGPTLIVLEATGGYEAAVVAALATAGLPVVVANPRQVRDFARATGQWAKTDAIDAQTLARFAEQVRPTPRPLPDEAAHELDALLTRRRQLVEMLTAERNRLLVARTTVRHDLQQHIRFLERRLREADDDLHTAVKASPAWRVKDDLLQSVGCMRRLGGSPLRSCRWRQPSSGLDEAPSTEMNHERACWMRGFGSADTGPSQPPPRIKCQTSAAAAIPNPIGSAITRLDQCPCSPNTLPPVRRPGRVAHHPPSVSTRSKPRRTSPPTWRNGHVASQTAQTTAARIRDA